MTRKKKEDSHADVIHNNERVAANNAEASVWDTQNGGDVIQQTEANQTKVEAASTKIAPFIAY